MLRETRYKYNRVHDSLCSPLHRIDGSWAQRTRQLMPKSNEPRIVWVHACGFKLDLRAGTHLCKIVKSRLPERRQGNCIDELSFALCCEW